MSKYVLIGPVYPYKGGISHYTSLLYRALSQENEVTLISYKMQYPKFMFKREQRDYSNDLFKIDESNFWINTANPINIWNVGGKIKKINPDAVIIQWWHPYFAPCYRILESSIGKHIKKIFICHNVFPHERFPLDKILTRMVLNKGNGFIVHSHSDGKELLSIKSDANYQYNPHPTYNAFKIRNLSKDEARTELRIEHSKRVLLFFGFVREYKGLKHLINAMPIIKKQFSDIELMIVGVFGDDKEDYIELIRNNDVADIIYLKDDYTPDNEVEKYFAASDLVVLPYESATQSGIAQIAFGFEKPVVVTNVGGLPDIVEDGKTGYVVNPKSPDEIAMSIIDFYKNNRENELIDEVKKEAYRFEWDRIVEKMGELIK